jgi:SAM-dependent methyltransferase
MGEFRVISQCRGCHAGDGLLEPVFEMDPMPLAGLFCRSSEEAKLASRFPLTWLYCQKCSLVQVGEDVSEHCLFETYNYASSSVPGLVRHFEGYGDFLKRRYGQDHEVRLLEIGCNDGVLLNQLPQSWHLIGVDPSDVANRAGARSQHYELISAPFSSQLVRDQGWVGAWDVITGSNCLAHISDLREVFEGVAMALRPDGWFWVELHDLDALLIGSQWDTIYHEHKVEWSVDSLKCCVEALGFELLVVEPLPLHGGVIRCGFRRSKTTLTGFQSVGEKPQALERLREAYLNRRDVPAVNELVKGLERGAVIAAYGASGRANVYLNQFPEIDFSFIVDEAPLRVNRYIPAVGTPIVSPSQLTAVQPDFCLITAWNYRDDIVAKNLDYKGKWLTAFPVE